MSTQHNPSDIIIMEPIFKSNDENAKGIIGGGKIFLEEQFKNHRREQLHMRKTLISQEREEKVKAKERGYFGNKELDEIRLKRKHVAA